MRPGRRPCLLAAAAWLAAPAAAADVAVSAERGLSFPRDHGAHPGTAIEWWYATGWLTRGASDLVGFQLTFFRSRTGLAEGLAGRLAPRQLLFGHAAVTELRADGHRHAQRVARWSGVEGDGASRASAVDTDLQLAAWRLQRRLEGDRPVYHARLAAPEAGFTLALRLRVTQPVLLQGQAGYSRKGPPPHASHYYTQPQLEAEAELTLDGRAQSLRGRAWLDHEWSDTLMPPLAVGWDWIGINLVDGGALTAFVLRDAAGEPVWAGGSHRTRNGEPRAFDRTEVVFTPLRRWTSPSTGASYPVHWRIATPAGRFEVLALLDAQELDSRASTGAVYWEGLAELRDGTAQRVGLGYLEMTGRASALRWR